MVPGLMQGNHTERRGRSSEPRRTPAPPWDPHSSGVTPSLSPTNRGDSTVPSTFPAEPGSAHTWFTTWGGKKREKRKRRKKKKAASITLQEMHFSNTNSFPTGWRRKTSHQLLPLAPWGSVRTHTSCPLTSPLHSSSTHTGAFPAPGKGLGVGKGLGAQEGGGQPGCISK